MCPKIFDIFKCLYRTVCLLTTTSLLFYFPESYYSVRKDRLIPNPRILVAVVLIILAAPECTKTPKQGQIYATLF